MVDNSDGKTSSPFQPLPNPDPFRIIMTWDISHIKIADSESSNRVTAAEGGRVHLAQPNALVASCRGMRV